MRWIDAAPIATMPLTDDRYEFCGKITGPVGWRQNCWMYLTVPSSYVEKEIIAFASGALRGGGSFKPEEAKACPLEGNASGERGRRLPVGNRPVDLECLRDCSHAGQYT